MFKISDRCDGPMVRSTNKPVIGINVPRIPTRCEPEAQPLSTTAYSRGRNRHRFHPHFAENFQEERSWLQTDTETRWPAEQERDTRVKLTSQFSATSRSAGRAGSTDTDEAQQENKITPPAYSRSTAVHALPNRHSSAISLGSAEAAGLTGDLAGAVKNTAPHGDQLRKRTGLVGTTTRSGRTSRPVLSFSQTTYSIGEKARDLHLPLQRESRTLRKNTESYHAKRKVPVGYSLECSARSKNSMPRKHRKLSPVAGHGEGGAASGVINISIAAGDHGQRNVASGDAVEFRVEGRRSGPVLDWWRRQRLPHNPGEKVATASRRFHQGESSPKKSLASDRELPSTLCSGTSSDASGLNAKYPHRSEAPSDEKISWTQSQLHSLRAAQVSTDPSAINFWVVVASKVEGRGPQQCQQKWFEYFSTLWARRSNTVKLTPGTRGIDTPTPAKTPNLSQGASIIANEHLESDNQSSAQADADDLFLATPMRQRNWFEVQSHGDPLQPRTPRTPAGPSTSFCGASTAKKNPGEGLADYKRGVSSTYVQAMSKKMRKKCGVSQLGNIDVVLQIQNKVDKKKLTCVFGKKMHAASTSRGQSLKASVSASGAVIMASPSSSDGDEFSSHDLVESDEE